LTTLKNDEKMKIKTYIFTFFILFSGLAFGQDFRQDSSSEDIENFWEAYDKITSTKDTLLQQKYLNELYLDRGTEGLKSLVFVRSYT